MASGDHYLIDAAAWPRQGKVVLRKDVCAIVYSIVLQIHSSVPYSDNSRIRGRCDLPHMNYGQVRRSKIVLSQSFSRAGKMRK